MNTSLKRGRVAVVAVPYSRKMNLSDTFHYASQPQHSSLAFTWLNLIRIDATTRKAVKFKYKIWNHSSSFMLYMHALCTTVMMQQNFPWSQYDYSINFPGNPNLIMKSNGTWKNQGVRKAVCNKGITGKCCLHLDQKKTFCLFLPPSLV